MDQIAAPSTRSTNPTMTPGGPVTPKSPEAPDTVRHDFEQFVQDTLGHTLPIFGRGLFSSPPGTFSPAERIPVQAGYVLGPGDELLVRAWGKIDVDAHLTVDRNGQIFIPRVGTIAVAGTRFDQVQHLLHETVAQQFKDFQLTVTLGQLRSIQIYVLGQAKQPGVYTVSSLSTLVDALFVSGGPSLAGSMRDIQVKRDGHIITHLDVYSLLLAGDKSADIPLLPGDILYIPDAGPRIATDGNVNTPAIFEIKNDTNVAEALADAGGLTSVAGVKHVMLERISDRGIRQVEEFTLDDTTLQRKLRGGDILRISPISAKIENAVTLRGSVAQPGRYMWHDGMRVSDLIPSHDFLLTRSYYNQLNAMDQPSTEHQFGMRQPRPATSTVRRSDNDVANRNANAATAEADAADHDAVDTQHEAEIDRNNSVPLDNAAPDEGNRHTQSDRNDSAFLAGSQDHSAPDVANHDTEINWNYAVIQRLNPVDLKTELISFALGQAIAEPSSSENKVLQAGDIVVVYSRKDLPLPQQLEARFVRIDGEIMAPGLYRLKEGETLRDVVQRAGGFTPRSYLYAARLDRNSVRVEQEARLQQLIERIQEQVLSPVNVPVSSGGTSANASSELAIRQAYIARLSQVHPTGRVVLRLPPGGTSLEQVPDFTLEDGDHFFVPAIPNTVDVLGTVYNEGALRYVSGQRISDYLNAAGGPSREADRKREFIIRADGTTVSRQAVSKFNRLPIYPGDAVIVPPSLRFRAFLGQLNDWTQLVTNFALGSLAIKALQ